MKLTCYVHDGWQMHIRPAPSTRAWMDATPEKYAYRCLPLSIANTHGWEIFTPAGFWATWTGDESAAGVQIRSDRDMPSGHAAGFDIWCQDCDAAYAGDIPNAARPEPDGYWPGER